MRLMHILRSMRLSKLKLFILVLTGIFYAYYFLGIGDHLFAKSFDQHFDYPLDIDVRSLAERVLEGDTVIRPINKYPHKFLTSSALCESLERADLVILVKSAMDHYHHRSAIRYTFGRYSSAPGLIVRTIFFLGVNGRKSSYVQDKIDMEMDLNKDMIQMDFIDDYYSNTNKTMMAFRWAYENCSNADYYLFSDDDMYVSVANLLDFARYGDTPVKDSKVGKTVTPRLQDKDKIFYAGYVFNSAPLRHKSSKWVVSYNEYPYDKWPPYITAGAYIVSNKALKLIYIGSQFIKHFKFDDVYLGIVAYKLKIKLTHCPRFHFYKKKYTKAGYKDVIASHGYGDQEELVSVWHEQIAAYPLRRYEV